MLREELLGEKAQNAMRFQNAACLEFGPAEGLLLRELVFWCDKGHDPTGFIYKTQEELKRAGLSRWWQRKARKNLVAQGVLEEERRGVPPKWHFRVDLEELMGQLYGSLDTGKTGAASSFKEDLEASFYEDLDDEILITEDDLNF